MRRQIVIVGAGYAGVLCAARLARKARKIREKGSGGTGLIQEVSIAIVDPRSHFVERIRLHEDAASGTLRPRVPLKHLLRDTGVSIWQGTVKDVDLERRRLSINDGEPQVAFDDLVIATGSTASGDEVPGVVEHALRIGTEEDVLELAPRLRQARSVIICGGGLTGVELAAEIAGKRRDVTLVTSGVVASALGESARAHIRRSLSDVRLIEHASIVAVERDAVVLGDGAVIHADCVIWCAGLKPSPLPRAIGLATDSSGRAIVDVHLRSTSHSFVHVAGDAARFELQNEEPLRMACATANPMGAFCADDLAREIAGREQRPFQFAFAIQCVSLGRKNAIVQRVDMFDRPITGTLRGRPAAWIKEGLCRFAIGASGLERLGISYPWPKPSLNDAPQLPAARVGSS